MRKLVFIAKIAITLGLLSYVATKIDVPIVVGQIRNSDLTILGAGTLMLGFQPLLGAARWRTILHALAVPLSFESVVRCTYISVFLGQVLPSMIGTDALRIWLANRAGCRLRLAVISVGLDRFILLISLFVIIAAGTPIFVRLTGVKELVYLTPLPLGGSILGLVVLMTSDYLPKAIQQLRGVRTIVHLARNARNLFLNSKFTAATVTLAIMSHIGITLSVYLFVLACNSHAHWTDFVILVPPVLAASMLPISIGGWGTREIAMITALGTVGISADTAIVASVWLGVASILIALPGVIFYLADRTSLKTALIETQQPTSF